MTTTPTRPLEYTRPWLYDKQKAAIFCPERYSVVEASTKSGKSVGCMVWLAEQAMVDGKNRNYWWSAPIYAQAKLAYRRLQNGLPRAHWVGYLV